jgi:conserved oligomeric Golgi complex subunit 5
LGGGRLDDPFLEWTSTTSPSASQSYENPQAASSSTSSAQTSGAPSLSADVWTRPSGPEAIHRSTWLGSVPSTAAYSASAVLNSPEWKTLQAVGLFPLQQAFLHSCRKRLYEPLQYMFPVEQAVTIEDGGAAAAAASGMVMLPSKYDIQRFDEHIRQELSLADPRKEGGGDLTLVGMIADCVCDMIAVFCERAMTAVTGGEEASLVQDNWNMSDGVQHDRKVAAILHATAKYLKNAGDKTFVSPYRPSVSPQHEEAARICQAGLEPALAEIERMVKNVILYPVCRSANRRILDVLAKMHHGVYIDGDDVAAPSFVQKYLAMALERIGQNVLARFPPEYASIMSSRVASFTILAFCSNASLLRPLGENARLHVTQDLADLELALDQLVLKNGGTQSLGQVVGKPYAELRAMRQMLFWTGLENSGATAQDVAKSLLREPWILDVRPSTVLHYLFSFAPKLLSSPHHSKKLMARDYVATLVSYVGLVADGEDGSWMTTMACCDSYQQRSSSVAVDDGDARVPQIILLVGQELMRRKQSVTNLR